MFATSFSFCLLSDRNENVELGSLFAYMLIQYYSMYRHFFFYFWYFLFALLFFVIESVECRGFVFDARLHFSYWPQTYYHVLYGMINYFKLYFFHRSLVNVCVWVISVRICIISFVWMHFGSNKIYSHNIWECIKIHNGLVKNYANAESINSKRVSLRFVATAVATAIVAFGHCRVHSFIYFAIEWIDHMKFIQWNECDALLQLVDTNFSLDSFSESAIFFFIFIATTKCGSMFVLWHEMELNVM